VDNSIYLPISILLSTLILSGTLFIVGAQLEGGLTDLSSAVSSVEFSVPAGTGSGNQGAIAAPDDSGAAPQDPTVDFEALASTGSVEGSEDAPVTIVEFSDFQCPFCSRFYTQTLLQLRTDYIDTGKVKLIYRDFPLSSLHPEAQPAAEASECAADQGKFWEFHDLLFENQAALSTVSYKKWAADLGLNTEDFNSCFDTGKHRADVQADFAAGSAAGVSGTPTFFINGQKVVGAQPYSVFQQIIDAELAQ